MCHFMYKFTVAIVWRSSGDRVAIEWRSCGSRVSVTRPLVGQRQAATKCPSSCPGSRILDAGAWIQEPRSRNLNPGSWSTDPGSGILITGPGSLKKHHAPCHADHNVPAQNVPPCCAGSKCTVRNVAGRAGAKRARAGPNVLCRAS